MITSSLKLIGQLSIPGKNGEHSYGDIFYGNSTKRHTKSHHTWEPLHYPCSLDDNQHMDNPHAFSNYVKTTLYHGLRLSEVDWGDSKGETTKHGPSFMEVDWGGKLMSMIQVNVCSLRLIGDLLNPIQMDTLSLKMIWEVMIQVFTLWMDTCSLKLIGELMIQVPAVRIKSCSLKFIGGS